MSPIERNLPGVIPWWTTNGCFTPEEAERQLDDFIDKGVTEFFVYPNFGLEAPDFLTEEWFDFIGWLINACKARGMRFWLYDELSWPSGSSGGRLCREHPELLMRSLHQSHVALQPGESWHPEAGKEYYQIELANGEILSPTQSFRNNADAEQVLIVTQKILVDDHFFCSMGTSGTRNETGIMDALNPDAVRCFMSYNYFPYAERFPAEMGRTVRGFFFDEPTMVSPFHTGDVPWTPGIEALFEAAYHYPMQPHLRALFENIPGEEQFRLDFWSLVAHRFADAFAKQMSDWCTAHNLLFSGHCWPEEPSCQRLMTTATGDIHLLQQYLQVPGTDVLYAENAFAERAGMCPGTPGWARNLIYSAKHPASTARYNGAHDTICEMSGIAALGDAPNAPAVQKIAIDFLAAMGISIMNPARPYDMTDFRKHVCALDAGEPYWKYYREFAEYLERLHRFNHADRTQTRLAVLNPVTAKFALSPIAPDTSIRNEKTPLPEHGDCAEAMLATLEALVKNQRDFELIFEEVIAESPVSEAGELLAPESAFTAIVLPQCYILDAKVAARLAEFAARGGQLIAVGEAPRFAMSPGGKIVEKLALPVVQFDPQAADFAQKLTAALGAAEYTLVGGGAEGVLAQMRGNAATGWTALLLVNGTSGAKSLHLAGRAAKEFHSICDLATGRRRAWHEGEAIELAETQSVLLETVFAPISSPAKRSLALPADGWEMVLPFRNAALVNLEVLANQKFVPIADDGKSEILLDPERTPEVTLRGTFTVEDAVPEDLRLWLDYPSFRELSVNGHAVTATVRENVIDPKNAVAPIAPFAHVGENVFTVTVTLSPWLTEARGIRVHFGLLMQACEPPVLLGNFRETAPHTIAPASGAVRCGDLAEQGFAHFAGELTLERAFVWDEAELPAELAIGEATLPVAAELNGIPLGVRLWQNGTLAIPAGAVHPGKNVLRLYLAGEVWNMLRRRWVGLPVQVTPFVLPEIKLNF